MISQSTCASRNFIVTNQNGCQTLVTPFTTMEEILADPLFLPEVKSTGCIQIEIAPLRHGGDDLTPSDIPVVGKPNSDE